MVMENISLSSRNSKANDNRRYPELFHIQGRQTIVEGLSGHAQLFGGFGFGLAGGKGPEKKIPLEGFQLLLVCKARRSSLTIR